ncbi:uncharacterized protein LOC143908943 [Arctopsyche grandis]|uniref:uncharacterized protein LOC143908943 n=1 Tax=Arctopsyche grandis TaxID=121162 RepID=UPI00406D6C1B
MGRSKMIAKSCPKCDQQVAVATKSCKCGHTFFSARTRASLGSTSTGSSPGGGGGGGGGVEERRRTGRVRRARPHFYDSQDYQRQKRKTPKRRSVSQGSFDDDDTKRDGSKDNGKDSATAQRAARRRALKLKIAANEARAPRVPPEPVLDPARLIRCTALLHEINRKMAAVTWSPDK